MSRRTELDTGGLEGVRWEEYTVPAEWEPHEATWMVWPSNPRDWPGKMGAVRWAFCEIVRKLAPRETVHVVVPRPGRSPSVMRSLERAGVATGGVRLWELPADRSWVRDSGPVFLLSRCTPRRLAAVTFRFNGWGRYPDCERDNELPHRICELLRVPLRRASLPAGGCFVLEGGAFDTNGRGAVLVTEECLLDRDVQPRNPGLDRPGVEGALRRFLGVDDVLWIPCGIAGDDTHGHVDEVARFVGPSTVAAAVEPRAGDENHRRLARNLEVLRGAALPGIGRLDVVEVPMPSPLYFEGVRLPASYLNFYVANDVVLVPTFNDPMDRVAVGILSELFPGREVVGIHSLDLVWGFGSIHCLTQQQPAAPGGAVWG